jgi:two-component system LytT family response regulator
MNNELKVIIVDDEPSCIETLTLLLRDYNDKVKVIATANSAEKGLSLIEEYGKDLDILFLDIQMPGGDGFSLLERIPSNNFSVIFTTAYDRFALKAIKYSALDYLLKPIDNDELRQAIEKYRATKGRQGMQEQLNVFKSALSQKKVFEKLAVPTLNEIRFIQVNEILYFESDSNYTTIHLAGNGQKILSSKNIGYYEELLDEHQFCRIHNSYLVNVKRIESYIKGKGGYIALDSGVKLEVSVRRKEVLMALMGL